MPKGKSKDNKSSPPTKRSKKEVDNEEEEDSLLDQEDDEENSESEVDKESKPKRVSGKTKSPKVIPKGMCVFSFLYSTHHIPASAILEALSNSDSTVFAS
jgi:hypothetical protein